MQNACGAINVIDTLTLDNQIWYKLSDIEIILNHKIDTANINRAELRRYEQLIRAPKDVKTSPFNFKKVDTEAYYVTLNGLMEYICNFDVFVSGTEVAVLTKSLKEINGLGFSINRTYKENLSLRFRDGLMTALLRDMPIPAAIDYAFTQVREEFDDIEEWAAERIVGFGRSRYDGVKCILTMTEIADLFGVTRANVGACLVNLGYVLKSKHGAYELTKIGQEYGIKRQDTLFFSREVLPLLEPVMKDFVDFKKAVRKIYNKEVTRPSDEF